MDMSGSALSLHFSPLLGVSWLTIAIIFGVTLTINAYFFYKRNMAMRLVVLAAFLLLLLNPSILKEDRKSVKDVGFIVVDQSMSQNMGMRHARTNGALAHLKENIEKSGSIDLKIIEAPQDKNLRTDTRLFESLDQAISNVPQKQRAGVIFLTDGQVHDVPQNEALYQNYGPVHTLLTGEKNEKDRQIVITKAPAYGLVGKEVTIQYRIEDTSNINATESEATLTLHDGSELGFVVPTNTDQTLILKLEHPGENVFFLEAAPVDNELTLANNKTAVLINGVRDRLKVLLVSGVPHTGERPWRDLLTSDPGVDLVHFTILREPEKFDFTPQEELSLIAFPFRELFEIKLYDFDLIIFDRYRQNNILPDFYFENIAQYVKKGGAFLEASGPSFAGQDSIYTTPLRDILPGRPTGQIFTKNYYPSLTELGQKHPVTSSLIWNGTEISNKKKPNWGQWLRQIEITPERGDVLMTGVNKSPLLVLERLGEGRVAQIASDHLWLWARGYDGGGPHAELLRRVIHWLMKEPELDERALEIKVHKNTITIQKQDLLQKNEMLAVTAPNGTKSTVELKPNNQGWLEAKIEAKELGIYAFEDTNGTRKFAVVGILNPPELHGIKTTAEKLAPLVTASGGTFVWLEDKPKPVVRFLEDRRNYGGNDWIAFRKNKDFTVTGVKDIPLLPEPIRLALLFFILTFLWWREGRIH